MLFPTMLRRKNGFLYPQSHPESPAALRWAVAKNC
jgi:hypothetical protein